MPQSTIFPIFLRAEYQNDGQGFARFQSHAQRAAMAAKREFASVGAALNAALTAPRTGGGSLDLGTGQLREQIRAQEQAAIAAREVATATRTAAIANGELRNALTPTVRAYFDLARSKETELAASRAQLAALEAVQAQINQTASATTVLTGENLRLAQAEAGAANGATLLAAILRGTALEQGRVTTSARESARAFEEAFAAQEAAANVAAAAQQRLAASANQLRGELDPMFVAQQRFDQELARADALLEAGTISTREYAAAQQLARNNLQQAAQAATASADATQRVARVGTTAASNVINSQRASRTAFIQLGQQMQDVAVQAQLGTNAFIIFGQQVPQAAFALSGLADSANRTAATVGRFATFLSGPFGAGIFVAIAALGPLVQRLFETEEAADLALDATKSLADQQINFANFFDVATGAIVEQNTALIQNARLKRLEAIDANEANIKTRRSTIEGLVRSSDDDFFVGGGGIPGASLAPTRLPGNDDLVRALASARGNKARVDAELARLAESDSSNAETARQILNLRAEQVQAVREVRRLGLEAESLENGRLQNGLLRPPPASQRATPSVGNSPRAIARDQAQIAEAQKQLADFADQSAEQVTRINDRFSNQPRLILQSLQAMRQLDAIIGDTNERMAAAANLTDAQRKAFEGIISNARQAQQTVIASTAAPLELIRQESQQRLKIEELLAAGRNDEAVALQAIFQLEQQLGTEAELRAELQSLTNQGRDEEAAQVQGILANYGLMREEVRGIVLAEESRLRVLRDQQQVFNAQLDVVSTVRRDLTAILSGRSTDFFGNFRQALQDLQGQRLFESIFGDTFRQIEEELQDRSPQGRANAAFANEVNKTAVATRTLGDEITDLAGTVRAANDNIAGGGAVVPSVPGVTGTSGEPEIVVTGETDISRLSINDLATRISRGIATSIGGELEDLLGPRFAGLLGDVIGGVIAGQVRGGTTGGILGGLEQLTGGIPGLGGLSSIFGKAGAGAGVGTQVAGISKLLGIGGSTTGAQIGGAVGSFIPIPGGQIIGSIAGSVLGGLLKGTPRGSANLTGVDQFTLSGNNKSGARDTAGTLAGEVSDSLRNIARQIGAELGSFAVSIGVSGDSFHVDPTGRGRLRKSQGGIDFNQDQAAAVAFAIGDAIADGAIRGLSDAENRLLRANKDIEAALADVLQFQSVFDRLQEIRDPLGGAIGRLNTEFEGLIELFERAGASTEQFADLEELYNIERARAIEEATDRVVGSLRQLLSDLTTGDNGLSLRSRRNNALTEFNGLAARVAAGDSTAFDDFADVSQQLLDIERQLFGSTQSYFDRLAQITALTETAIADQTNGTTAAGSAPSPFADQVTINRSIDTMNANLGGYLKAINDNLIALNPGLRAGGSVGGGGGGGGSIFAGTVQNF